MAALNYHHLRHFWAIAREGGLTRAAERLNIAQSALSTQLKALETELGQPLFERRGKRLELTEAGRIALDHAERIFRTGEELVDTLVRQGPAHRRALRIGAVATLSRNFQASLLRPLLGRSDVELILRSGTLRELLAQLDALALDAVLSNTPVAHEPGSDRVVTLLAEQPVSLVGPAGSGPLRFPEDLAAVPLLLPGRESSIRQGFDLLLDQANIRPVVLAEVDDAAMLRLLARASAAVTLVPPIVVQDELRSGVLEERAAVPGLREGFYAITQRRRFPNPLLAELLDRPAAA
ncbi:LysR family transcriptional regulator [Paracraurococcus ruber]|uniref:LysR family transcriptional regulator n=1 Tax=Paracraurococcus ruber TaxID=77675 RepID=A0ABS1CXE1_9PROT|nr:LysR family transcriptional regulator [Paracraurococcus ruber]MBK1659198.1 LysR family transcriptional regulator [Paracraurococcus ruber]TDG32840.1 LysR family transcriptional regulator [Paracraurococcus ruber]